MSAEPPLTYLEFDVAGGSLAAIRIGPEDAPAVLAVHGITGNNRAWIPVGRALAGRASLIAVDLRGRGSSRALPAPYGTAAYVADLVAVIEQAEISPAVVAGHSLGAYITSRLAVEHPGHVRRVVLVDGGLTIPGTEDVDPQEFTASFLGPALARLELTFATEDAYHAWWHAHPALSAEADVADADLHAYADHDLVGEAGSLHSSVIADAIRADAGELPALGSWAQALTQPAQLLCAPRGLQGEPSPMQPLALCEAWAAGGPERTVTLVEGVNHYTITLGARGAGAVASALGFALGQP